MGAIVGPIAASAAMGALGPAGLYVFVAAVLLGLAGFILFRMSRRPARPVEEQGGHVPIVADLVCLILPSLRQQLVASSARRPRRIGQGSLPSDP